MKTNGAHRVELAPGMVVDLKSADLLADGLRVWLSGESGSGKSNAAMLIAEQLVKSGTQVVILDSHGEYGALWGAKPAHVVRYGYGEDPVNENSVDACLQVVRDGDSLLIDLKHWSDLEPQKLDVFMFTFMRELFELRRSNPRQTVVFIEEAHTLIPQQQAQGQAGNIRVMTSMLTGGRKFGLYFVLASQRQSMVDSNVIAACNVRIFMRTSEARDFKRVKPYVPGNLVTFGDKKRTDMSKYGPGEAFVVSRWWNPKRVQLNRCSTNVTKFLGE